MRLPLFGLKAIAATIASRREFPSVRGFRFGVWWAGANRHEVSRNL